MNLQNLALSFSQLKLYIKVQLLELIRSHNHSYQPGLNEENLT